MKRRKWIGMAFIISLVLSGQWTFAAASGEMANAMRDAGLKAQTAQWASTTSRDDGKGNIRRSTNRFYLSGSQFRMEMQEADTQKTTILIDDGKQQYIYDPQKKTAMVMNEMMRNMYAGFFSSDLYKQAAEQRKAAKSSGSESINGKPCTIFEYQNTMGTITSNVKEWVWVDKQFPMKSIVTTPPQNMTVMGRTISMPGSRTETIVTEVSLDKPIPASMFRLPPGVTPKSMGGYPFGGGGEEEYQEEQ